MTQMPQDPNEQTWSEAFRQNLGHEVNDTKTLLGAALFQILGILGLIVIGACVCGAGLYFQIWFVAIVGGVLISAGVLWAAVLAFLAFGAYL